MADLVQAMLESQHLPILKNFCLKNNVLRKHESNKRFINDLASVLREGVMLVHVDFSGMLLSLAQLTVVLQDGLYVNKRIACAHIGYVGGDLPGPKVIEEEENGEDVKSGGQPAPAEGTTDQIAA